MYQISVYRTGRVLVVTSWGWSALTVDRGLTGPAVYSLYVSTQSLSIKTGRVGVVTSWKWSAVTVDRD